MRTRFLGLADRNPKQNLFPILEQCKDNYPLRECRRADCADERFGHREHHSTAEYAHLANTNFVETAEKIGSYIATEMYRSHNIILLEYFG